MVIDSLLPAGIRPREHRVTAVTVSTDDPDDGSADFTDFSGFAGFADFAEDPADDIADSDGFERRLLRARSLIDSTVVAYRSISAQAADAGRTRTHDAGADPAGPLPRLVDQARQRVSATVSGDPGQAAEIASALVRRTRTAGRPDHHPVVVRLLCTPKALDTPLVRHIAPRLADCDVRVTEVDLDEALVIDGRVAVVRAAQESDARGRVMDDPAAARTLELLLACAWRAAVPLDDYERLGGRLHIDIRQRVLECLYSGCTDADAARDMKVSLRTYRRHVAKIMRDLGVTSRFQAGVRAAELHLLPECG